MAKEWVLALKIWHTLPISILALLSSAPGLAGTYELVKGGHNEVCEAYRRNFESRRDPEAMACGGRYDSGVPGFSEPNWTKLNLNDHLDLYRKTEVYLLKNDNSPQGMKLSDSDIKSATENPTPGAETWHVQLYVTQLDLAGDGHLMNILKVRRSGCGADAKPTDKSATSELFFLNDTLKDIDYKRQDNMNGWFERATIEIYEGRPYIEVYEPDGGWRQLLTGNGILHVFQYTRAAQIARPFPDAEVQGDGPVAACELKYIYDATKVR